MVGSVTMSNPDNNSFSAGQSRFHTLLDSLLFFFFFIFFDMFHLFLVYSVSFHTPHPTIH